MPTRRGAFYHPGPVVDLHAHILPGIDDGPADLEESIGVAREAAADGVVTLAATPHLRHDYPSVPLHELAQRCAKLNEHLDRAGIPLHVEPGGEVDILWAQQATAEDLKAATFGQRGSDLLLETPYGALPPAFEELVFRLSAQGLRLLLAHPERSPTFQRDPGRLAALVRRGVLVQVTSGSLAKADKRSASRRMALSLVEQGLAHVISSDAHTAALGRPPGLSAGVAAAAEVAPARARWMVTDAPAAILAGERLPPPPAEARSRPWLRRLLRRSS